MHRPSLGCSRQAEVLSTMTDASEHEARGADQAITSAIDGQIQAEQRREEDDDGTAGVPVPAG